MTQHIRHAGLPADLTRWQLLRMVETARRALGLSKGAVSYLRHAIGLTMDGDFAKGRICAFWTSVTKIAASLAMERRQIARIEAELIGRGLIHKSSTNRSGLRLHGVIRHEFGINLAPLISRALEIRALAQQALQGQTETKALRKQINKLFERIRALDCNLAQDAAAMILPNHCPSTIQSFQRLQQVTAALEAVLADVLTDTGRGEMSHQCDISTLPNTQLSQINKTCRVRKKAEPRAIHTTPEQVWLLASDPFR